MISLWPNSEKCDFLYDPGSKYSMITTATYDHLKDKLPISTTNLVDVSVQKVPFKLDGIIRINCQFYDEKGDIFLLPSEPFLISDAIDSNIFGMHTEHLSFTIPMIFILFFSNNIRFAATTAFLNSLEFIRGNFEKNVSFICLCAERNRLEFSQDKTVSREFVDQ